MGIEGAIQSFTNQAQDELNNVLHTDFQLQNLQMLL